MVGNGSNVRVSADYSNTAPSQPTIQSFRQPGNGMTPSNFRWSAHDITMSEMPLNQAPLDAVSHSPFHNDFSLQQPYTGDVPTDNFQLGNNSFPPILHVCQEDIFNPRTLPYQGCFDPLLDNSLIGSAPIYTTAIPGRPKHWTQPSVEALFHTSGQKNPEGASNESSVPGLIMEDPKLSHPGNNLHFQNVMSSEGFEQVNVPYKAMKYSVGASSPLLPENTWYISFDKSRAASTQCSPPSP